MRPLSLAFILAMGGLSLASFATSETLQTATPAPVVLETTTIAAVD